MAELRGIRACLTGAALALGLAGPLTAGPVRDLSVPMQVMPGYQKERLVGHWFEVARSPSMLEPDCQAVTADVETREDSRLTLKILCHKGSVTGPVLNIDGILVEIEPGVFQMRFVRLQEFGALTLAVLWQSEDDSLAVLGEPLGKIGWIWSKSASVDAEALARARDRLVSVGYAARSIKPVEQIE